MAKPSPDESYIKAQTGIQTIWYTQKEEKSHSVTHI